MKNVDLDEPTSFLDHVYLGCTQREDKPNNSVIDEHREMFDSRISAGAAEKLPAWEQLHAKAVAWSYDMKDMLKSAWTDTANWRMKRQSKCTKFQLLAWMITTARRRSSKRLENCPMHVLKSSGSASIWHELVDLTFFDP